MSASFKSITAQSIGVTKRTAAKEKLESGESIDEGKKIWLTTCIISCVVFFSGGGEDYLFSHLFIILKYILLAISDTFFSMHMNHLQWSDYCLLFYFGRLKKLAWGETWGTLARLFKPLKPAPLLRPYLGKVFTLTAWYLEKKMQVISRFQPIQAIYAHFPQGDWRLYWRLSSCWSWRRVSW